MTVEQASTCRDGRELGDDGQIVTFGEEDWHGTSLGYQRRGCKCDECLAWKRDAQREYRERPGAHDRDLVQQRAAKRALTRLRRRHVDEYREIYAQELAKQRTKETA